MAKEKTPTPISIVLCVFIVGCVWELSIQFTVWTMNKISPSDPMYAEEFCKELARNKKHKL